MPPPRLAPYGRPPLRVPPRAWQTNREPQSHRVEAACAHSVLRDALPGVRGLGQAGGEAESGTPLLDEMTLSAEQLVRLAAGAVAVSMGRGRPLGMDQRR